MINLLAKKWRWLVNPPHTLMEAYGMMTDRFGGWIEGMAIDFGGIVSGHHILDHRGRIIDILQINI